MVAIVGQTARSAMGGAYQQEVDLLSLFKDVASEYCQMVTVPEQLPNVLDRAHADRRQPAHRDRGDHPLRRAGARVRPARHTRSRWCRPASTRPGPPRSPPTTRPAARRRRAQRRLQGRDARRPGRPRRRRGGRQVADLLGAGVAKALLGKDVLSDELPWVTGSIGLLGTRPSLRADEDCDTLLVVGSNFPYTQFLPGFDGKPDVAPSRSTSTRTMVGLRYPFEVNLVGDAAATLQALMPLLERKEDRSWRETVEKNVSPLVGGDGRRGRASRPTRSTRCASSASCRRRLPEDAMIAADSGSAANWYARQVRMRGTMRGTLSGTLATMGCGVPYAIGAKFAHPDRPAYRLGGRRRDADERPGRADHHRQLLAGLDRPAAGRRGAAQRRPQPGHLGAAGDGRHTAVPAVPAAARLRRTPTSPVDLGLRGIYVTTPTQLERRLDEALAADRPCLLDFRTDPAVPPDPAARHLGPDDQHGRRR